MIGVSFGGMVAVEVSKLVKTEKLVLISSLKTRHEIPLAYRIAGLLKLHVLMPAAFLKSANWLTCLLFGVKEKAHKQLLKTILSETDSRFLKWAMNEITDWQNQEAVENTVHIHGTCDRILPIRRIKNPILIDRGGHLMVVAHAEEVSSKVNFQLNLAETSN